eukprot:TRINITY_DN16380_c0_g1_i1.p1 TRINITY_DN16380_c0_g1~~TRINITY_DN16380_c0_g1_i1.p1  ORF type:complete len:119 (+),score=35.19 TRINITY_DN16380_c0_g1_i1:52-408(+)
MSELTVIPKRKVGGLKLKGKKLPVMGKDGKIKNPDEKKRTRDEKEDEDAELHQQEELSCTDRRTDAELRFEKRRREKLQKEAEITGKKTYRDNIEELNIQLSTKSEFNDIPKVTYNTK